MDGRKSIFDRKKVTKVTRNNENVIVSKIILTVKKKIVEYEFQSIQSF